MMVDSSPKLSGEPTADALASGLASLGRYGDNYMVHAAEGETIVPKEILESNPGLKDDLFRQMTMMGIENPNRYVVGSDLNSINPITGQPEFFFKKIFKTVKKIAKKILPVAAPIIGNLIAPGIGGIVASGLVSKMQGGSWGDAAKSAALSYGVGALGRGIQGGFAGGPGGFGEGFTSGLGRGLTEPWRAGSQLFASGASNPLAQGIFGPRGTGTLFKSLAGTPFAQQDMGGLLPAYQDQQEISWNQPRPQSATQTSPKSAFSRDFFDAGGGTQTSVTPTAANLAGTNVNQYNVGDTVTQNGQIFKVEATISEDGKSIVNQFVKVDDPGFFTKTFGEAGGKLAKAGAVGGAALVATSLLNEEEESVAEQLAQLDQANPKRRAYEKWLTIADKDSEEARSLKREWYGQPALTETQLAAFGANPLIGVTAGTVGSPAIAATGGEIIGPGTGTSDSIPARLSDGEFVMTAEAVRNAGGGDRELGAARMYDMMNRFERGVA